MLCQLISFIFLTNTLVMLKSCLHTAIPFERVEKKLIIFVCFAFCTPTDRQMSPFLCVDLLMHSKWKTSRKNVNLREKKIMYRSLKTEIESEWDRDIGSRKEGRCLIKCFNSFFHFFLLLFIEVTRINIWKYQGKCAHFLLMQMYWA